MNKAIKWGMIKTDGGLWTGPEYLIKDLEKRGWHYVVNPKRSYYQEYDQTNPNYSKPEQMQESSDLLYVEVL